MTYEGARSITDPFLQILAASAAVVGFTAGSGELVGYALRSVAEFIGDRTGRYWPIAIFGYAINMLAVPALAPGFTDFASIACHFEKTRSVASGLIPGCYAATMAMGAISALALGRLFDRLGVAVVIVAFLLSSFFAPFVLLATGWGALRKVRAPSGG